MLYEFRPTIFARSTKSFRISSYKDTGGVGGLATVSRSQEPRNEGGRSAGSFRYFCSLPRYFLASLLLINPVHRDSAQQLRIKIRRFLRQDLARRGNAHHLLDLAGIQQERDLRRSAVH